MHRTHLLPLLAASFLPLTGQAATIIESWQFNESTPTQLTALTNDAGSATWSGNKPQVVTDGSGALTFTVGTSTSDNVYRNATLTSPDNSTGDYEMQWSYLSATLDGGVGDGGVNDPTGANMGFGMRDEDDGDLFLVRLQRQNNRLLLQTRVGTTNTTLDNFGSAITTIPEALNVRVVAHLDDGDETFDVYWKFASDATESSALGIGFAATGLDFDEIRMVATTNSADWGASDEVKVDSLTVAFIPEPGTTSLLAFVGLAGLLRRRR